MSLTEAELRDIIVSQAAEIERLKKELRGNKEDYPTRDYWNTVIDEIFGGKK